MPYSRNANAAASWALRCGRLPTPVTAPGRTMSPSGGACRSRPRTAAPATSAGRSTVIRTPFPRRLPRRLRSFYSTSHGGDGSRASRHVRPPPRPSTNLPGVTDQPRDTDGIASPRLGEGDAVVGTRRVAPRRARRRPGGRRSGRRAQRPGAVGGHDRRVGRMGGRLDGARGHRGGDVDGGAGGRAPRARRRRGHGRRRGRRWRRPRPRCTGCRRRRARGRRRHRAGVRAVVGVRRRAPLRAATTARLPRADRRRRGPAGPRRCSPRRWRGRRGRGSRPSVATALLVATTLVLPRRWHQL